MATPPPRPFCLFLETSEFPRNGFVHLLARLCVSVTDIMLGHRLFTKSYSSFCSLFMPLALRLMQLSDLYINYRVHLLIWCIRSVVQTESWRFLTPSLFDNLRNYALISQMTYFVNERQMSSSCVFLLWCVLCCRGVNVEKISPVSITRIVASGEVLRPLPLSCLCMIHCFSAFLPWVSSVSHFPVGRVNEFKVCGSQVRGMFPPPAHKALRSAKLKNRFSRILFQLYANAIYSDKVLYVGWVSVIVKR